MSRFQFAEFTLDTDRYELIHGDRTIAVERRVFDLLVFLLRHRNQVVAREQIIDEVWQQRVVTDGVLTQAVTKLRRILGGETERIIKTIHGVGYRFIAEVSEPAVGGEQKDKDNTPVTGVGLATVSSVALAVLVVVGLVAGG